MPSSSPRIQPLADCRDPAIAGGKAVNLGRLIRAGFPVPGGFVITAAAYAESHPVPKPPPSTPWAQPSPPKPTASTPWAQPSPPKPTASTPWAIPPDLRTEILCAYRDIGDPLVAVRSSATAEDLAHASMAGQYETYLNIQGPDALLAAIQKCWHSVHSPRTAAYLREHNIDPASVSMAVVVQKLIHSDSAGVLFTASPDGPPDSPHPSRDRQGATVAPAPPVQNQPAQQMIIEGSFGLGESVVSGRVQPDIFHLDFSTGRLLSAKISDKRTLLAPGAGTEESAVDESRRRTPCLNESQLTALWQLGRRAQDHFAAPQDIEWAIENGTLFLLQSRPITTLAAAHARQSLLRETRAHLQSEIAAGRGPFVLHNLAETLPHPTPLTWSVIRPFMSGSGGFGKLYQTAGFSPSDSARRDGFLELIAGRIYMDASRAPDMFSEHFPFRYDPAILAHSPDPSQSPPTVPAGSLKARMNAGRLLANANTRLHTLSQSCEKNLRQKTFPAIRQFVLDARQKNLAALDAPALISLWQNDESQILTDFAADLLLPSLIAGMATADLSAFLAEHFFDEDADSLAQSISSGGPPNSTVLADVQLFEVGQGRRTLDAWLADHGHRGSGEFDLASPRHRENSGAVQALAHTLAAGEDPRERHDKHASQIAAQVAILHQKLPAAAQKQFDILLSAARAYLPFREDAKNILMLAYDLLRDLALEFSRRLSLGPDVFLLTRDELFDALFIGTAPRPLIEFRKITRTAEARIKLPRLITQNQIPTLGHPPQIPAIAGALSGFPVSAGHATGPARLIESPTNAQNLSPGYILVCPSTDPSWTPLFINAGGLILERGGSLSHGAVVAREMGLPAVVLEDAMQIFKEGESLTVDGANGRIARATDSPAGAAEKPIDPADTRIPAQALPPPPSAKEKSAGKIRNLAAAIWAVYLALFFLLPGHSFQNISMSIMDAILWPIVRTAGKPLTVILVAAVIALATLLIQKFLTDNPRLLIAKKRAAALTRQAAKLPRNSPRRKVLAQAAASVQSRLLLAALVPAGILLGPLVMPFAWFKDRIDPSVWSPPAGSAVQIVATVQSDFASPITLWVPPDITIDDATPAAQDLPPLRPALEHLLALYQLPPTTAVPWEISLAPDSARHQTAADLQSYLDRGIPPQSLTWLIRPPKNFTGQFPITVHAGDASLTAAVTVGDTSPPALRLITAAASPLKSIQIVYPGAKILAPFWQPFHTGPLSALRIDWLWLYILAYLPVLFLARAILRIA